MKRMSPQARPGMAASQYSCPSVRVKPISVSLGAMALGRNQTQNARIIE